MKREYSCNKIIGRVFVPEKVCNADLEVSHLDVKLSAHIFISIDVQYMWSIYQVYYYYH